MKHFQVNLIVMAVQIPAVFYLQVEQSKSRCQDGGGRPEPNSTIILCMTP